MAEMLRVSENGVGLDPGSIDDLDEVLRIPAGEWLGLADLPAGTGVMGVSYNGSPPPSEGVYDEGIYRVRTFTFGDRARADVLRTLYQFDHPGARREQVRGYEALVYEHPTSPMRFDVFWMESPTIAVLVSGLGTVVELAEDSGITVDPLTEAKTLDFADGLHPATPEEANLLLSSSEAG